MDKHKQVSTAIDGTVPGLLRNLSSLENIDYIDSFSLGTPITAAPEEWARAMFGDTPDAAERFIWMGLLRLRLDPTESPDRIAGWSVNHRADNWIRLEASSPIIMGNLIVYTDDNHVSLTTCTSYRKKWGSWVWRTLSPIHRHLTPQLIVDASRKLESQGHDGR